MRSATTAVRGLGSTLSFGASLRECEGGRRTCATLTLADVQGVSSRDSNQLATLRGLRPPTPLSPPLRTPLPPHLRSICRCRGQVAVRRSGFATRPILHSRGACSKPRRSARCRERTGMTPRRRSLRRARRPGCAMVDGPRSSSRIKDATARCRCAWVGLCKRDAHEHTSHLASQPNPPPPRPHHHQV